MSRAAWLALLMLWPATVEACATCIASPYGDRTYSWPYLMLILLPFVVAAVIAGVLAHVNGITAGTLWRRLAQRFHPVVRHKETT